MTLPESFMNPIHSLSKNEILSLCTQHGFPAYRAGQIWKWLYVQKVSGWNAMKNIPAPLQSLLAENFSFDAATAGNVEESAGQTRKLLVKLQDGECIEEVLLGSGTRKTVCVSCQVGCKFKCAFCASGQAGFKRNLEPGEMVGQFLLAERELNSRVNNLVFMGMGEPFDNYDAVLKAARIINDQDGLCLGARKITVSTCGIIPGIKRLSNEGLQIELSVSLHAPDNDLRSTLMPVNRKYPLKELLAACDEYSKTTKRIITFEYTLINGVNDTETHAGKLASLLSKRQCRVNLIPLSAVSEYNASPSNTQTAGIFVEILKKAGINATLRNSQGSRIKAACGQLRCGKGVS